MQGDGPERDYAIEMHGLANGERRVTPLEKKSPTPLVCMTCTGMYGNGWRMIFMTIIIMRPRMEAPGLMILEVRIGWPAAARGTPPPGTAGRRPAARTAGPAASGSPGFGLPALQVNGPGGRRLRRIDGARSVAESSRPIY